MSAPHNPQIMGEIHDLAEKLAWARDKRKEAEAQAGKFKGIVDGYQNRMLELFEAAGIKSVKDKHGRTISSAQRPKFTVTDEQALRRDLEQRDPDAAARVFVEKVDGRALATYATPILKADGEVFDGVDVTMTEYVSVRKGKAA